MMNTIERVRNAGTVIIGDTADYQTLTSYQLSEGTTNPSLIYLAAKQPAYQALVDRALQHAQSLIDLDPATRAERAAEYLSVLFGVEIYGQTGRVSTEVDVKHSFSVLDTVAAALRIIDAYQRESVPRTGVRIKISATWEGIQAGRILELQHGVSVLITVVFGLTQAITAAEAGVSCIAPYVGRIGDWYQAHSSTAPDGHRDDDMGVLRVREMQNYLRKYDFRTQVMAASFRSTKQVRHLAGIDLMTIAPVILQQMEEEDAGSFEPSLTAYTAQNADLPHLSYIDNESAFRWAFNSDACAVEKSAEAMRKFGEDTERLTRLLDAKLAQILDKDT